MRARSRMASHQAVVGVAGESGNGRGCQPGAGSVNVIVVGCRVWVVMGVVYNIGFRRASRGTLRVPRCLLFTAKAQRDAKRLGFRWMGRGMPTTPHPRPLSPLRRGE